MDKDRLEIFQKFVDSVPAVQMRNPYWTFDDENKRIISQLSDEPAEFKILDWYSILKDVKVYFKQVFDSFHSEAQVLCVRKGDGLKLDALQIPKLPKTYQVGRETIQIYVLPQENSYHLTSISEEFWQKHIIGKDIHPIARIHSHHELEPYQSPTDYASLNSNTLELVIGKVNDDLLSIGFWLDQRGKSTKEKVWVYEEESNSQRPIKCGKIRENDIDTLQNLTKKKENE